MITNFDDFCLWVYCIVEDTFRQMELLYYPYSSKPGPLPCCTDSELMAMALIGECKGWDTETVMLSEWRQHRDLFPNVPTQSRFNRRRRSLAEGFNLVRKGVLAMLDLAADRQCALDSLPVPVVNFHLAPCATREWAARGAAYGTVSTKKEKIYGYKLHLLTTLTGVILDFELAPANASDVAVGEELLREHTLLTVVADKGYISAALAHQLLSQHDITLLTLRRANQKKQLPRAIEKLINQARQIVETVNGQLDAQFNIETNHAHSFTGLCVRLYTKLTAHTLSIYINRLLGNSDFLCIKKLAFPI